MTTADNKNSPRLTLCKTPALLTKYSSQISPFLHRVEKKTRGLYTAEKIAERFQRGEWHCWVVLMGDEVVAVGASHFWLADNGDQVFTADFIEGDRYNDWYPFAEFVWEWARKAGCSIGWIKARKGHASRALRNWSSTHRIFERRADAGRRRNHHQHNDPVERAS